MVLICTSTVSKAVTARSLKPSGLIYIDWFTEEGILIKVNLEAVINFFLLMRNTTNQLSQGFLPI